MAPISAKVKAFMTKTPSPSFAIGESFRPDFDAMSAPEVPIILTLFAKEEILSMTDLRKGLAAAGFLDKNGAEHSPKNIELAINRLKKRPFSSSERLAVGRFPPESAIW